MADDAGALLVRSGLVSASALEDARARVARSGGTIGEQLVAGGLLSDDALTDFYRSRLLVPQVNPNSLARLAAKVVASIPSDMAIDLRVIPVSLDADNNLTVAMSDPSDRHAVDEIAFFTGSYVVRAVATQMQIAWCLAHYYGHVTALGQRLLHPSEVEGPSGQAAASSPSRQASQPLPRTKGFTGKIEAARHRGLPPMTGPVDIQRPPSNLLGPTPSSSGGSPWSRPHDAAAAPPATMSSPSPDDPGDRDLDLDARVTTEQPRARSVSGEIRVPRPRAASIKPPLPPDDGDDSGPVITMEVSADDDTTGPRQPAPTPAPTPTPAPPARKRKAKTDPPELAARAGELDNASRQRSGRIALDTDRSVVIAEDIEEPLLPTVSGEFRAISHRDDSAAPRSTIEVSDEASAGVVIHDRLYDPDESKPILLERRRPQSLGSPAPPPPSAQPDDEIESDGDDEVVVLDETRKKKPTPPGDSVPPVSAASTSTSVSRPSTPLPIGPSTPANVSRPATPLPIGPSKPTNAPRPSTPLPISASTPPPIVSRTYTPPPGLAGLTRDDAPGVTRTATLPVTSRTATPPAGLAGPALPRNPTPPSSVAPGVTRTVAGVAAPAISRTPTPSNLGAPRTATPPSSIEEAVASKTTPSSIAVPAGPRTQPGIIAAPTSSSAQPSTARSPTTTPPASLDRTITLPDGSGQGPALSQTTTPQPFVVKPSRGSTSRPPSSSSSSSSSPSSTGPSSTSRRPGTASPAPRGERRTQMGIGITPSSMRAHRDTTVDEPRPDDSAIPGEYDDRPTTADVALPDYAIERSGTRDPKREDDPATATRGPTTARGHAIHGDGSTATPAPGASGAESSQPDPSSASRADSPAAAPDDSPATSHDDSSATSRPYLAPTSRDYVDAWRADSDPLYDDSPDLDSPPDDIDAGDTSDGTPSGEMTAAGPPDDDNTNPHISTPAPRRARVVTTQHAPREDAGDSDELEDDDRDLAQPPSPSSASASSSSSPQTPTPTSRASRQSRSPSSHVSESRQIDYDPVDDGWGPPGTTIPPPLLGAIPGSDDDAAHAAIPMSNIDSAPLMVAPPSPPEPTRSNPGIPLDKSGQGLVRSLEVATSRAIDLIRLLEHARDRDEVVAAMIAHLAETHRRAGFFSIKTNPAKVIEISLFQMAPKPTAPPAATLRLDRPSTLQDVVGTRLPYRGPMHDDASRTFLTSVLGACPPEILLVPVTVRERVVGVLFGEHRVTHTFDDQLAMAARAAGMALERILKAKRS